MSNVYDNLYDLDNALDNLYDLDNVPDNLYDLNLVPEDLYDLGKPSKKINSGYNEFGTISLSTLPPLINSEKSNSENWT